LAKGDESQIPLGENPDAVEGTQIEDRLVLTGSTEQVQAFIMEHAEDERLFPGEVVPSRQTQ